MYFQCPHCDAVLDDLNRYQGKVVECPCCGKALSVPIYDESTVAATTKTAIIPAQSQWYQGSQSIFVKSHRSGMLLTLAILSLAICGLLGIFVYYMAKRDLEEMDAGIMDSSGRGTTQAAKVIGVIALAYSAIATLIMVIIGGVNMFS